MNDSMAVFLKWCEANLPSILLSLGVGYKFGQKVTTDERKANIVRELDLMKRINDARIEARFKGISDADILAIILDESGGVSDSSRKP